MTAEELYHFIKEGGSIKTNIKAIEVHTARAAFEARREERKMYRKLVNMAMNIVSDGPRSGYYNLAVHALASAGYEGKEEQQ